MTDADFATPADSTSSATDLEWHDGDPASTEDIAAAPPSSRGRASLLVAAVVPVVAQAVVGALVLRQTLRDPDAVAQSTRMLGAVGLGALVFAILVAWTLGQRAKGRSATLDPTLLSAASSEVEAAQDATRRAENERDLLQQRVGLLTTTLAEASREVRSQGQVVVAAPPAVPTAPNAEADIARVAEAAAAASGAARVVLHEAQASTASASGASDWAGASDMAHEVDRIEVMAAEMRLLALNAAIEASGVGAEGTRFAVVAEEVRKLADEARATCRRLGAWIQTLDRAPSNAAESSNTSLVHAAHHASQAADTVAELVAEHASRAADPGLAPTSASSEWQPHADALEQLAQRLDHVLDTASPLSAS